MKLSIDSYRGEQFTLTGRITRGDAVTTAAVLAGAAVIPVDSTGGYPNAGSLDVGGVIVTYTGTTPTSLTGCAGTPAIARGALVPYAVDVRVGAGLVFAARRRRGDAAPLVTKSIGSGITIPAAAPGHIYNVAIVSGDTSGFTKAEDLVYELRLTESNGDVTVIAEDRWRVGLGAS